MLYDSWICIFIHWKKTTENIWKIFVVINMIFKANIYIVIAEGKGIQYFELATAELQFDCSATRLQTCSNQTLNQAKHFSSAVTISGSIQNSLSSKPLPVLTVQLKMIWQTQLGSLWWNNLEMGFSILPDVSALSMKCIQSTPTKISS